MITFQSYKVSVCRILISAMLLLSIGIAANGQDTSLVVISNVQGAPSEMKIAELKSVFKFERQRWRDGTKVTIVMMKTSTTAGKNTCSKIYNRSGQEVLKFFSGLEFAGKIDRPILLNSAEDVFAFVADNPGSIGITNKVTDNPTTKIILIDGKKSF